MHSKLQLSTPKCSLYAKTFKKTQIPIYDALGPFPDEALMSSIDRVLFLFGGRRVQNYFNLERSLNEVAYTCSCKSLEKKVKRNSSCNCSGDECCVKESPTYSVIQIPKYAKCVDMCSEKSISFRAPSLYHHSRTPIGSIKENTHRQDSGRIGIPLRVLKRSFSLCSLACRKLKNKLSVSQSTTTSRSQLVSPKWLWAKVENYADGCQLYEVFKNSSAATHPTKFDTRKASKIIFLILPTGIIMPFETIPHH